MKQYKSWMTDSHVMDKLLYEKFGNSFSAYIMEQILRHIVDEPVYSNVQILYNDSGFLFLFLTLF